MGRRACTPPNAPGEARATSPRVYVRWPPVALVPAAPCAHAAARSAWLFARTGKLVGALGGAGGLKKRKQQQVRRRHPRLGSD